MLEDTLSAKVKIIALHRYVSILKQEYSDLLLARNPSIVDIAGHSNQEKLSERANRYLWESSYEGT